jgi:hypothetical protein
MTQSPLIKSTHCCALALALAVATPALAQDESASPADTGEWTELDDFGAELTEAWIPVPNGESGAPRQGWLATADGFFTREAHLAYSYTDASFGDAHEVLARFHYPLSRRLWAGVEVPFYRDLSGSGPLAGLDSNGFGDVTLTTQVMLAESRNLSVNAGVGWRIPVGDSDVGGGVFAAEPQLNLFSDIGSGISLRGRVSYSFPDSGAPESFALNFAIGQTVTDHDNAPLGDFTYYVAGNWREFSDGGGTFLSVTPGVRTHLGGNLFALAGIEIPVTNTDSSFSERFIFQLVQGF